MAFYQTFTSVRTESADPNSLLNSLRSNVDTTIGVKAISSQEYKLKKETVFSPSDITECQTIIDNAPSQTEQLQAQAQIDKMPIALQAVVLALVDQLNILRSRVVPPLNPITPAQAFQAIRAKAGTL